MDKCGNLSAQVFHTLTYDDVYEVSLVQQCHSLEQLFGTHYLHLCLRNPLDACSIIHNAKTDILAKDWEHTIRQTNSHPSLAVVAATDNISSSWNAIWDKAFEYGI